MIDSPFILNKEILLYENKFTYKDINLDYNEIESIVINYNSVSINLIKQEYCNLEIFHGSQKSKIEINSSSSFVTCKKTKDILHAYEIFECKSFKNRMFIYLNRLKSFGYLQLTENVKLYIDGTIEKKSLKLNLKKAKLNNTLVIGTSFYFGAEGSTNPYEILVSETGMSAFSKRIIFETKKDHDVIQKIVSVLSVYDC